jgi:hypothetical protein
MKMSDRKSLTNRTGKPHIFWDQWLKQWNAWCPNRLSATIGKNDDLAIGFVKKLNSK